MNQAQEQRAAAAEVATVKEIPADGARLLPFPALLRVGQPIDWNGAQRYELNGIASTVEMPYRMFDQFGEYKEVIDRAAFDQTLVRDPDVAFLVNHKGVTMARSRPNSQGQRSLELSMGPTGLQARAYLNPQRQDVADLVHAIRDGDVTEMSFAFRIDDGEWNDDFSEFRINKVDLNRGDVSAVNYGANPYTSIAARSSEVLRDLDRLPAGAARAALQQLQARRELQPTVVDLGARKTADELVELGREMERAAQEKERERLAAEPKPPTQPGQTGTGIEPTTTRTLPDAPGEAAVRATVPADAWHRVQPGTEIWARSGMSDPPILLGRVDEAVQDDAPGGPVQIRTTPTNGSGEAAPVLAPSPLLPPTPGLKPEERSDLGRSVHLVRLQWTAFGEDEY